MAISNVIIDGVPAGGEDDFVVLDTSASRAAIDNPKDHLELGEALGRSTWSAARRSPARGSTS